MSIPYFVPLRNHIMPSSKIATPANPLFPLPSCNRGVVAGPNSLYLYVAAVLHVTGLVERASRKQNEQNWVGYGKSIER